MITDEQLEWIKNELSTGKVHAIVAYQTILTLENQRRENMQIRDQLHNCQSKCKSLRGLLNRETIINFKLQKEIL